MQTAPQQTPTATVMIPVENTNKPRLPRTKVAQFWDRTARGYAEKPVADEASYQRKLALTRQYLQPDMELLEIGCGTGSTAITHAPHVAHIHATDLSRAMLDIAQQKAVDAGVANISFEEASVEGLSVANGAYDMVLALSVLHLLEDPEAAVAKIHAALRPGGLFVSSTMSLGDSMNWFRPIALLGRMFGLLPYIAFFNSRRLHNSLSMAGFEVIESYKPKKNGAEFLIARKP